MRYKSLIFKVFMCVLAILAVGSAREVRANDRQTDALKEEVRHQLVMLPYYSVFDWLQAEVKPDGTVTLMGQVVRPILKDDAEKSVKKLEAATRVINNIDVLPLSPMDDQLR